MTERPFNGDQEAIFKSFEKRSEVAAQKKQAGREERVVTDFQENIVIGQTFPENVVDDGSSTFNVSEFFAEHPKLTRAAAMTTAFGTVFSAGASVVAAAENPGSAVNPTVIEYKQPGDINQKYTDALNKVLLADASTNTDATTSSANTMAVESMASKETVQASFVSKFLVQTDSPYCEVTNSITGDVNAIKKMDSSITMVSGSNMIPTEWAKMAGYEKIDSGNTKIAILSKDSKKITVTAGSKTMTVTETGKAARTVTMTVAAQMDKSGKLIMPIGTFSREVLGGDAQWDSKTKTIGVNYTAAEFAKITKTEVQAKELKHKALQYVSGGEFMNAETFTNPLEKLSVGATVVYSSEKNKAAEKKEVTKYQSKIQKDDVVYCIGGKTYLVRPNADTVPAYSSVKKEGVFVLQTDARVSFPKLRYYANTRVDYKTNGLVETDGLRVTHDYNSTSGKWVERTDYEVLGNPAQRIRKSLNKFLTAPTSYLDATTQKWVDTTNPMGLDKKEVEKYNQTGSDKDLKSFKVMKDAKGNPAFFVMTGGQCGLNEQLVTAVSDAVDRWNQIDPTAINLMTNRNGLNCVAFDIISSDQGIFKNRPLWGATYENQICGGFVLLNQNNENYISISATPLYSRILTGYEMFIESRALLYNQHTTLSAVFTGMPGVLSDKPGIVNEEADKYRFILQYLDQKWLPAKVLTRSEYQGIIMQAEPLLKAYDPSYVLTYDINFQSPNFIPEK